MDKQHVEPMPELPEMMQPNFEFIAIGSSIALLITSPSIIDAWTEAPIEPTIQNTAATKYNYSITVYLYLSKNTMHRIWIFR